MKESDHKFNATQYLRTVTVDELGDSSINIGFKMWVETTNYLAVKTDMLEKIIDTFREENINIPYNKLDVNIMK